MDRELTIAPLLIHHQPQPQPTSWVKILIYEPTEEEVVATRGKMYAILTLSAQVDFDFAPLMQAIIEMLQQQYFGNKEGGILQTLQTTLDNIHAKLLLAGQQDKRLADNFSFNLLTAVSWGSVLYFGQLGPSRACLLRQGKLYDIDEGEQKSTNLYLSSGNMQAGDRVLLATTQLVQQFDRAQLQQQLTLPSDTVAQSLEQQLSQPNAQLASGILLLVDIKQVPSIKDEAIIIHDSAELATHSSPASQSSQRLWQQVKASLATFRRWRLFGKLPGPPMVIGLIFIIGLVLSIVSFSHRPATVASTADLTAVTNQLQASLSQAQSVAIINPDRAEDLLTQMEPSLSQALAQSHSAKLDQIATQRQNLQQKVLAVKSITSVQKVTSLATTTQSKLAFNGTTLYLINPTSHQLLAVTGATAKTLATNSHLFTSQAKLALTTDQLVVVLPSSVTQVDPQGHAGSAVNVASTASFSVASYHQATYILSPSQGQVNKITDQDGQLGQPATYFHPALSPDGLLDLAIDGSVYLLRQGTVEQYVAGARQSMVLERSSLLKNVTAILTDETSQNLYFLTANALLFWSKTGSYGGQYQLPNQAPWQAVAVDESHQTLYILSQGQLLKASIPK